MGSSVSIGSQHQIAHALQLEGTQVSIENMDVELLDIGVRCIGQLPQLVKDTLEELGPLEITNELHNPDSLLYFEYIKIKDGNLYHGQILNGLRHGLGRQNFIATGNYIEGMWKDDNVEGEGRLIYGNGDVYCFYLFSYQGQFVNNKPHGKGILINKNTKLKQTWNQPNSSSEQRIYEGDFEYGFIQGRGQFTYKDGRKYIGEVNNGLISGVGYISWHDHSYYNGNFQNNNPHGFGCYTHTNLQVYKGYFISVFHPDEKKLVLYYSNQENIQDKRKLKQFKKQYKLL